MIGSGRFGAHEDEIPAERRYCTRDEQEFVPGQQFISKRLLTGAGNAGPQPVRVGNSRRLNNVNM
jgi:hypothetical protein